MIDLLDKKENHN